MILHSFTNAKANTTTFVNKHINGFSVTMRDNDSSEFFPSAVIYSNEAAAIAKAKQIAEVAS